MIFFECCCLRPYSDSDKNSESFEITYTFYLNYKDSSFPFQICQTFLQLFLFCNYGLVAILDFLENIELCHQSS